MRRLAVLGGVVVALVCLSGVLATADPGGGAWVVHDGSCNLGVPFPTTQVGYQKVVTPSGNAKLTCRFAHDEELKKAIKETGFPCAVILPDGSVEITEDSQRVLTPGGNAILVCMIKANAAP